MNHSSIPRHQFRNNSQALFNRPFLVRYRTEWDLFPLSIWRPPFQLRDSHYKDRTVRRPFYFCNGNFMLVRRHVYCCHDITWTNADFCNTNLCIGKFSQYHSFWLPPGRFNKKTVSPVMGSIIKIRPTWDRLIFIMGIPIPWCFLWSAPG